MVTHTRPARKTARALAARKTPWPAVLIVVVFAISGSVFLWRSFAVNPNLQGDINNDNIVNLTDLSMLLSKWNSADSTTDLNGDGQITLQDLSILLTNWNKTYTPSPPPPTPPPAEYLANEQFNGTSLNGTQWVAKTYPKGYRNNEEQDYRPGQAKVENGSLVITANKDGSGWHSAEVESTWRLRYGEFETRMRLSAVGAGVWPAAWLLGNSWPGDGEIDIMESINATPTVYGTIHAGPSHWQISKNYSPIDITQWHTYKIVNQPGHLSWYVDGVKRGDYDKSQTPSGSNWPFDSHDYYGILNLAMGGSWPGPTNGNTPNPVVMYVDYFTVKKL